MNRSLSNLSTTQGPDYMKKADLIKRADPGAGDEFLVAMTRGKLSSRSAPYLCALSCAIMSPLSSHTCLHVITFPQNISILDKRTNPSHVIWP